MYYIFTFYYILYKSEYNYQHMIKILMKDKHTKMSLPPHPHLPFPLSLLEITIFISCILN